MSTAETKELYDKVNKVKDDMTDCKLHQQDSHNKLEMQIKENRVIVNQVTEAVRINADKVDKVCDSIKPIADKFNEDKNASRFKEKIIIGVAVIVIASVFLWVGKIMLAGVSEKLASQIADIKLDK